MIRRVWLKNFRRYRDAVFELHEGLNFIEGENNAGKTTLFLGIEYALFGAVAGLSPAALLHPGERAVGAEITFEAKDGGLYKLQRMHARPPRAKTKMEGHFTLKRLLPDGAERYVLSSDFQDHLETLSLQLFELTGLSRRLFDAAVFLRQGQIASVLEGAPGLDIVLGVTAAVVTAEETSAMALEREKEAESLPVLTESLKGVEALRSSGHTELTSLAARRAALDVKRAELARRREEATLADAHLAPLEARVEAWERGRRAEEAGVARVRDVERRQARFDGGAAPIFRIDALLSEAERRAGELAAVTTAIAAARADQSRLDVHSGDLRGRLARRRALPDGEDARCEACGTIIDRALHAREIEAWDAELSALEARRVEVARVIEEAEAARARLELDVRQTAIARAQAEQRERELAALTEDAEHASIELARLREEMARERVLTLQAIAEHAPGQAAQPEDLGDVLARMRLAATERRARMEVEAEACEAVDASLAADRDALEGRLAGLEREHARLSWALEALVRKAELAVRLRALAQGFRELQAELRGRAAIALAKDTLALHRALSDAPEELEALTIDADRYVVHVTPRDVGESVPAHSHQGGGHKLLLGLAFRLALARLVGHTSFLLLDEPTYGLDQARREALLRRIREAGVARQILLVTHHALTAAEGEDARRIEVRREGRRSVVAS